jgi:hypothetical protein
MLPVPITDRQTVVFMQGKLHRGRMGREERRMSIIDILMLFFTCAAIALVAFVIMEVVGNEED